MQPHTNSSDKPELLAIAKAWGWTTPPDDVLDIAKQAKAARDMRAGDFLVSMGYVTTEQSERFLASKPKDKQTATWFAEQGGVQIPLDRVLALINSYAYYDSLRSLTIHDGMNNQDVIKQADLLDCALMVIENVVPVIVFSSFKALIRYQSLGRDEKMRDPMLRLVEDPQLAVAARDEISAVLGELRNTDASGSSDSSNIWVAQSAESDSAQESREVTRLLDHALVIGATDMAFKPFRNGSVQVLLRRFGQMIPPKNGSGVIGADLAAKMISLMQSKSGANPSNTTQRDPTDGQITYRSSIGNAFLRLNFLPLNHLGERRNLTSVSTRLLSTVETSISLSDLKVSEMVIEEIKFAMQMSQGLFVVCGPTNSGKTTLKDGAIGTHVDMFGDTQKRLEVADPVERFLFGITQINKRKDRPFGEILKAVRRHDPDMLSIGEVRDEETAFACVDSASTGQLVATTLHSNSALMGLDVLLSKTPAANKFQLVDSMSLMISQRLIKELCPHCCIKERPTAKEHGLFTRYVEHIGEKVEIPALIAKAHPDGCSVCRNDSYMGMVPMNEILPFTQEVKDLAIELLGGKNTRKQINAARKLTLLQSGMELLAAGRIELRDLFV